VSPLIFDDAVTAGTGFAPKQPGDVLGDAHALANRQPYRPLAGLLYAAPNALTELTELGFGGFVRPPPNALTD
jgi:hypothetical protein